MPAFAFEIQDRIDHVFDDARPRNRALFGDMPHQHDRGALALGECRQFMGRGADLGYRPGGALYIVGPHGLNRIDDRQIGFFGLQRGQNIAQVGFGREFHRAFGQPQPGRAHLHLCRGFLARDIDHLEPVAGEPRGGL